MVMVPDIDEVHTTIDRIMKFWGWLRGLPQQYQYRVKVSTTLLCLMVLSVVVLDATWASYVTKFTGAPTLVRNGGFEAPFSDPDNAWGTGAFERKFEDESGVRPKPFWVLGDSGADIQGIRDYNVRVEGSAALRILNKRGREPHVFGTIAQRIHVEPRSLYLFSFAYRNDSDLRKNAFSVSLYPDGFQRRIWPTLSSDGEWSRYTELVRTKEYKDLDVRFVSEDIGTLWIDDVSFKKVSGVFFHSRWFVGTLMVWCVVWMYPQLCRCDKGCDGSVKDGSASG